MSTLSKDIPLPPFTARFIRHPWSVTWTIWKAAFLPVTIFSMTLIIPAIAETIVSLTAGNATISILGRILLTRDLARSAAILFAFIPIAIASFSFAYVVIAHTLMAYEIVGIMRIGLAFQALSAPEESETPAAPGSPHHHVYFVAGRDGLTKIGMSGNLKERLEVLRTANGTANLVFSIPCASRVDARRVERSMHARFHEQRVAGEWFNLSAEHIEAIKAEHPNDPNVV